MSTAPADRPAIEPVWRRGRAGAARLPRVVLVPSTQRRSRIPFALIVLFLIGSGLIGLLLLNTVLAQDAFVLFKLRQQSAALSDRQQQLQAAVDRAEAPAALASRAAALGMVPGGDPLFLRLSDGAVLGDPKGAIGVAPPATTRASISPTPTSSAPRSESPSASPSAARPGLNPSIRPTLKSTVTPRASATPRPTGSRP